MKILITGSSGMLGQALLEEFYGKYELLGMDIVEPSVSGSRLPLFIQCDITDRKKTIESIVSVKPDIVIHTAAYTDVDGCELDSARAQKINAQGAENVALAARECSAWMVFISTDFVFDGEKKSAYIESDEPVPLNIYGRSKLEGENYVRSIAEKFIIIRTSWLFGKGGKNFVDTIVKKLQGKEAIKVVNDQVGAPTFTKDLAEAIKVLLSPFAFKPSANLCGIYHISNSGSCSWYEFALAVKEALGADTEVVPVSSAQYPRPARRPRMSILENRCYREKTKQALRPWKEALGEYLEDGKIKK